MKRLLCITLSIIFVLSCLPIFCFADGSGCKDPNDPDFDPYLDGWYDEENHDLYLPKDCFHSGRKTFVGTVKPTCTERGFDLYYCYDCKSNYKTNYVTAIGHDYNYVVYGEPTFYTEGTLIGTCKICQNIIEIKIPCINSNDYVNIQNGEVVDQDGLVYFELKDKSYGEFVFHEKAKCEHEYVQTEIIEEPTCTKSGSVRSVCILCDNELIETVPALGHRFEFINDSKYFIPPTGSSSGWYWGVCSICGKQDDVATEIPAVGLKIKSASLILNGKIDLIYYVDVPEDCENVEMQFTIHGDTTTVTEHTINEDTGYWGFVFTNINPQCIGDNVEAIVSADTEILGVEMTVEDIEDEYSVKQYCINTLSNPSTSTKLRAVCSDILAYGAAAQTYMDYKTSNLVTNDPNIVNPTYRTFTSVSGYSPSFTGTVLEDTCWIGASLTLTDDVAVNIKMYAEDIQNLEVRLTVGGTTHSYPSSEFISTDKENIYKIVLTGFSASDFDNAIQAKFYRNNTQISNTLTYYVNSYIQSYQNSSDDALKNLIRALSNYGVSVEQYVNG